MSDAARWHRVKELFQAALDREPHERATFLRETCRDDRALQDDVESLLAADAQAGTFAQQPAIASLAPSAAGAVARALAVGDRVLGAGDRLGPYEILGPVGAGGMGEVYKARDTRLDRAVAIKVLAKQLATDPQFRSRFDREARVIAALTHPHICTLYDVGHQDGTDYLVMEYLEGETLADRLAKGALPIDAAVRMGIEIADALSAAHEKGIVHRDLKPANVTITAGGVVKVLDFGLAKIVATDGSAPDLSQSASRIVGGTREGIILGTATYMSPEQARGKSVDKRTDIWAFGCVLFEMLTGHVAFSGETISDTIAGILERQPDWTRLPAATPPTLQRLLRRCLEKDPKRRLHDIADARIELDDAAGSPTQATRPGRAVRPWKAALEAVTLSDKRQSSALPRWAVALATLLTTVAIALGIALGWPRLRPSISTPFESIAVVPLLGTPAGSEAEYLTVGVSEGVINRLAQAGRSSLRVIALASTMRYKDRAVDPREIGHDLGVTKITLLRVARLPNALSISAELVDVRDGTHVWGEQYNTQTTNLLEAQSEIASQIADNLNLRLSVADKQRLKKRYTENIEAYQAYLQGRETWYRSQIGPEGYQKSLEFYHQAIARDPSYALAYSGVADTYVTLAGDGWIQPREAYEKAKEAGDRALAIDPDLGEAHFSMGVIKYVFGSSWAGGWDWAGGEKEYQRSIELNPNNAAVHRYYAQLLINLHRPEAAIAEMKKSLELDPLGPETNKAMGSTFYWLGRYDESIKAAQRALDLDPNFSSAHQLLSDVYAERRMYRESIVEQQTVLKLDGDEDAAAALGRAYAADGYDEAIRRMYRKELAELTEANKVGWVSPVAFVIAYAKLGEKDSAFAWLDKTYSERSPWLVFLRTDPDLESLRSDPRFDALAQRIGVP